MRQYQQVMSLSPREKEKEFDAGKKKFFFLEIMNENFPHLSKVIYLQI